VAPTVTENVHMSPPGIVPPERITDEPVAVKVPLPQVPLGGLVITRPDGRLSVNATPLRAALPLGLAIEKFRLVEPESRMEETPKLAVIEGGNGAVTVSKAIAGVLFPPELWAVMLRDLVPTVVPFTVTEKLQLGNVEENEKVPVSAVATTDPPGQSPETTLGLVNTRPLGSPGLKVVASGKEKLRSTETDRVEIPPTEIEVGENDAVTIGCAVATPANREIMANKTIS
jgi:hypothetical protein